MLHRVELFAVDKTACAVPELSRETPELLLQPCINEKLILPLRCPCCVLVRVIKRRNGLTRSVLSSPLKLWASYSRHYLGFGKALLADPTG